MSIIKVECKHCHYKNQVEYAPDLGGKKIMFKCQNKSCKEMVSIKMPLSYSEDRSTVIFPKNIPSVGGAYLELMVGERQFQYPLLNGIQVIGRKSVNKFPDIALDTEDRSVSRTHCVIESFEDSSKSRCFVIWENNSKNGLYLNGNKLTEEDEIYLNNGDELQLGNTMLTFRISK